MNREQLLRAVFEFFWERDRAALLLIDPTKVEDLVLPLRLMAQPRVVLGFEAPLPNFRCNASGVGGGLKFHGGDIIQCFVPWGSVRSVGGKNLQEAEGINLIIHHSPKAVPRKHLRRVK